MSNIYSEITFIKKQKKKPYYDSSAITGMIPKLYFKTQNKKVLIRDARKLKNKNIDKEGFTLLKYKKSYDATNIDTNLEEYKIELAAFLKNIINYKYINIFDLTKRSNSKEGASNADGPRQPAARAHVDYTLNSGPKRAKKVIGKERFLWAKENKYRVFQLNVWRPLSKIVYSSPLAFADARSINIKDLVATDQIFPDRIGEIYHLSYNINQVWYWVPEMKNNEILLLKGWDSINNKSIAKFTPHTSFNLAGQDIKIFPRESIEARIFFII